MNDQNAAPATVSIPFVYLRPKGMSNMAPHRILFPGSFDLLMKTAKKLFNNVMTVQSLVSEEGFPILSLDDVIPGSTILVSNLDAEDGSVLRNPPSPVKRRKQVISSESYNLLFGANEETTVEEVVDEPKVFSFPDKSVPKPAQIATTPKKKFTPKAVRMQQAEEERRRREEEERIQREAEEERQRELERELQRQREQEEARRHEEEEEEARRYAEAEAEARRYEEEEEANELLQYHAEEEEHAHSEAAIEDEERNEEQQVATEEEEHENSAIEDDPAPVHEPTEIAEAPEKEQLDEHEIKSDAPEQPKESAAPQRRSSLNRQAVPVRRSSVGAKSVESVEEPKEPAREEEKPAEEEHEEIPAEEPEKKNRHRHRKVKQQSEAEPEPEPEVKQPRCALTSKPRSQILAEEAAAAAAAEAARRAQEEEEQREAALKQEKKRVKRRKKRVVKPAPEAPVEEEKSEAFESAAYTQAEEEDKQSIAATENEHGVTSDGLKTILEELVGEGAFSSLLGKALAALPEFSESLRLLPSLELKQLFFWRKNVLRVAEEQGFLPLTDEIYGVDDMVGHARCLLMEHRFSNSIATSHRYNIGIIGPRESGKSTFLRLLIEELLVDLAVTGEWKKTFIFIIDMANVMPIINDYSEFYKAMVSVLMDLLVCQRPNIQQHAVMIQKFLESVVDLKNPPVFPKAFALDDNTKEIASGLQSLANRLSAIWNNPYALVQWVTSIVTLPSDLARIFGFSKTIWVMDHIDASDATLLSGDSPFPESERMIPFVDALKYTMKNLNFIVACQNQSKFYGILPSMTSEASGDMHDHIKLVSMVGLIPAEREDKQFVVDIAGESVPFTFTVDTCGGIPAYLKLWNELNELYDEIDKGDGELEELKLFMNAHTQQAMHILFNIDDNEPLDIVSVRRTTKSSKSK